MGGSQKYRDEKNQPAGPWFVQYPDRINPQTVQTFQALDGLKEASQVISFKSANVFLNKGRPMKELRDNIVRACRRAGIEVFRFNDLRHCFVAKIRSAVVSRFVIMAMTAHNTESMFLRYNTIEEQDMRMAVERAEHYFKVHQDVSE